MPLHEAHAVHKQNPGAAPGQVARGFHDRRPAAAIGRRGRIERGTAERRPFSRLGRNLLGQRHDDAELRALRQGNQTMILGDVNGDGVADFGLRLDAGLTLTRDAFLL